MQQIGKAAGAPVDDITEQFVKSADDMRRSKEKQISGEMREDSTVIMGNYKDMGSDNIRGEQPSFMESPSYGSGFRNYHKVMNVELRT